MADKTTGLKILIETEVQKALKDMGLVDKSVDDIAQSAVGLNKDLGATENAAEAAAKDLGKLGDSAEQTAKDFASLGGRSIAEIRKEADQARAAFKRLESSGEHSLEEIARAGKLLDKQLDSLEKEIKDVDDAAGDIDGGGFGSLKESITSTIAAFASLQALTQGVQFFAGFDDELRRVKAFTKASGDEFEHLKELAIDLGRSGAQTPKDIAAGMVDLAQSGSSVNDILRQTADVAQLAAGTELDFAAASDAVTDQMAQFGLAVGQTGMVVDNFITATLSAGQTSDQFAGAMSYVGGIANQLGEDLGDTSAAITLLADASLKGERGGTGLRGVLAALVAKEDDLASFGVKVRDAAGNFRELDDIVGDLADANLGEQTLIKIFGTEAWPAVAALLAAGEEGLESYEAKFKDIAGTGKQVSEVMQEGVGGALRSVTSELQGAMIDGVEPLIPAIELLAENAHYLGNGVNFFVGTFRTAAAVMTESYGVVMQMPRAFEAITDAIGITDDSTSFWADNSKAAFASASDLASKAASDFDKAAGKIDETAEAQKELDSATNKLADRFVEISKETGVTVKSMEELDAAVAAGKLIYDESAGAYISAEKRKQDEVKKTAEEAVKATEAAAKKEAAARKEAEKAWNDYLKTVSSITDQIAQRSGILGLKDELADLKSTQLSAAEGYQQIKDRVAELGAAAREAFAEAEKLTAAGDEEGAAAAYEKALEYADEAKAKAKELNKAVEDGDKTIVSQKEGFENAKAAVTEYGELGIEILEKWKASAQEAADTIDKEFNFSGLNEEAEKAADTAGKVGESLAEGVKEGADQAVIDAKRVEDALDEAAKDRTANFTVTERTVQAALHGGLIRSGIDLRTGAQVYGPTGYDSVHALLAGDEAVTQSKRVRELGYNRVMRPINDGQYDKALAGIAAYLGPAATREALAQYLVPPAMDMAMVPPPAMPRLDPVQAAGSAGHNFPNLGTIILQNDRTGVRFPVYAKPQDAPKLAAFLDDPAIKRHGSGGR